MAGAGLLRRSPAKPSSAFRADIEGLRAVAVGAVLLYHAGVPAVSGGFIGVDVFFVISGALITGLLLKELRSTNQISLVGFYARRAKRLLPATAVVMASIGVLTVLVMPDIRWPQITKEVVASGFYVVNWYFASRAVDYSAVDASPSPLQHFWTLSFEEQFYLIWPCLLLLVTLRARGRPLDPRKLWWGRHEGRRRSRRAEFVSAFRSAGSNDDGTRSHSRSGTEDPADVFGAPEEPPAPDSDAAKRSDRLQRALVLGLLLVALPSLAWSFYLTNEVPTRAYFVSTTRLWEMALGGALAIFATRLHRVPKVPAVVAAWAGLAAIVASTVVIDFTTPFPGLIALVPTLGATAVIACGPAAGRSGPVLLLGLRPMLFIGALSYSLYLWHWPLLIFAEAQFGKLTVLQRLVVVVLAGVPAWLSYRLVETPIRLSRRLAREPKRALALGGGCMASIVVVAVGLHAAAWPPPPPLEVSTAAHAAPQLSAASAMSGTPGSAPGSTVTTVARQPMGAEVLSDNPLGDEAGRAVDRVDSFTPTPGQATKDVPPTQGRCTVPDSSAEPLACEFGDLSGKIRIVAVGDSHMSAWVSALEPIARARGWKLTTYLKAACPLLNTEVVHAKDGRPHTGCTEWGEEVSASLLADPPNLLVVSQSRYRLVSTGLFDLQAAFVSTWAPFARAGIRVAAIRNTPYPAINIPECVAANSNLLKCAVPRVDALALSEAVPNAVRQVPGAHLIDLTDAICPGDPCAPVIGGVLVYRDGSHVTGTYIRSLTQRLDRRLSEVLNVGS